MKAVILESNSRLALREREMPRPDVGEYRIKIRSTGICNSDVNRAFGDGAYHYPLVMGHETCGTVDACGEGTSRFQPGDQVVVFPLIPCGICYPCQERKWVLCRNYDYYGSRRDGGYQEYLCVREWNLLQVPEGTHLFHASLTEPVSVCHRATAHFNDLPREKAILVIGGGLLGLISALILKRKMRFDAVYIADRNAFKRDLAKTLGLQALDMEACTHYHNQFGGILEACGASATYNLSLDCASREALVVWMGNMSEEWALSKLGRLNRPSCLDHFLDLSNLAQI